jgi:hypothetical protein
MRATSALDTPIPASCRHLSNRAPRAGGQRWRTTMRRRAVRRPPTRFCRTARRAPTTSSATPRRPLLRLRRRPRPPQQPQRQQQAVLVSNHPPFQASIAFPLQCGRRSDATCSIFGSIKYGASAWVHAAVVLSTTHLHQRVPGCPGSRSTSRRMHRTTPFRIVHPGISVVAYSRTSIWVPI